jgi:hypothetical protein
VIGNPEEIANEERASVKYRLTHAAGSDGRCNTLWSFGLEIRFKRVDPSGLQFAFT